MLDFIRKAPIVAAIVAGLLLLVFFFSSGVVSGSSGGVLMRGFAALAGIAIWLAGLYGARYIHALSGKNDRILKVIQGDPNAIAHLRGAYILGSALVVALIMG